MHELIRRRWSARGYDPNAEITEEALRTIVDAGRWAPTWGRMQPVRFVVGRRGDPTFTTLAGTLRRGNAGWAPASAALVLLCTTDDPEDPKPHLYGSVDLGLALSQMILQAETLGFNGHPMAGFDADAAAAAFDVPAGHRPLVLLAVGALAADPDTLPAEVRERDERPRTRLPLDEVAFAGRWGTPAFAGQRGTPAFPSDPSEAVFGARRDEE